MLAIDDPRRANRDEDARGRGKTFDTKPSACRVASVAEEGIARVARTTLDTAARDTLVDLTCVPSRWARFRGLVDRFLDKLMEVIREPRLSDRLPPPPTPRAFGTGRVSGSFGGDERGELMLLEIMRAPKTYQLGAIDVARYAVALARLGEAAYAEGVVHFVLSRMRPDRDGAIPLSRLRDILCDMPFTRVLVPALLRLEAAEIVHLVSTASEDAPAEPGSGPRFSRVELRVPL
jgi:hypothetical protein